eukprot:TRINITY_DN7205_c0_g1_i1.p1 TRINITY_DN7205_c0_g1~~TRINITY_DN7205_c0_g1_i1.p1  ORF type:complete len:482 (+),score=189.70 TRINITY_DN7205_c0_g1_i1:177-1622(+)
MDRKLVGGVAAVVAVAGLSYYYRQRANRKTAEDGSSLAKSASYPEIERLLADYSLRIEQLRALVTDFQREMLAGLHGDSSTLKMIPSFVGRPSGQERGTFYALDLGGSNFRVMKLELCGDGRLGEAHGRQFTISKQLMHGDADQLFDFIAACVKEQVNSDTPAADSSSPSPPVLIGFTFSFPVDQQAVARGTLIHWTKGFVTRNVVGRDVVELLDAALQRQQLNAKVVALVNDTVGTLVACAYADTKCEMGVIMGTGCNACYNEKLAAITKFSGHGRGKADDDGMIVNMEWGGFGSKSGADMLLPLTTVDRQLDLASNNVGGQFFEKMVAGMYLGEIVRLTLRTHPLFQEIKVPYSLDTEYLSRALGDNTAELSGIEQFLTSRFNLNWSTLAARQLLKRTAEAVTLRAARLSATAIAAVLSHTGRLNDVTVAIDGSVFEKVPGVKQNMEATIKQLYPDSSVRLVLQHDGSGLGAAIIAASV